MSRSVSTARRAARGAMVAALFAPAVAALGAGTFDSGNEGWRIYNVGFSGHQANLMPVADAPFDGTFGNPAGSLRVGDVTAETSIGAPDSYLGDNSDLYGQSLSYDGLYRFEDDASYPAAVLVGAQITLYCPHEKPPLNTWQRFDLPLVPGAWRVNGDAGPLATEDDLRAVLADLRALYIRTEWKTGTDDTSIDNVSFGGPECKADVNGDGALNLFDFLAFQGAFGNEDPLADFAPPYGVLNIFDFLAFQTAFGNGC